MAYEAVISLKQTINRLLNSSRISIVSSSRQILEFVYKEVNSIQKVLERWDDSIDSSQRLNALDGEIRDAVHKLEDLLEFHESNRQLLSQSESQGDLDLDLDLDLEELRQEINSLIESVTNMEEDYIKELDNHPLSEEEEDDNGEAVSTIGFGEEIEMVGLSDELYDMKNNVVALTRPKEFGVLSIIGMPGTGRTIIAYWVFSDLYLNGQQQYFDCGAWISIGPKYQFEEILQSILGQIDDGASNGEELRVISQGDEKNIAEYLYKSLEGKRYIIVLDDICDTQIWDLLRGSVPEQNNGSLMCTKEEY